MKHKSIVTIPQRFSNDTLSSLAFALAPYIHSDSELFQQDFPFLYLFSARQKKKKKKKTTCP
jgi:hypothetical protein